MDEIHSDDRADGPVDDELATDPGSSWSGLGATRGPRSPAEGVRIIGAEEAAAAIEAGQVSPRVPDDAASLRRRAGDTHRTAASSAVPGCRSGGGVQAPCRLAAPAPTATRSATSFPGTSGRAAAELLHVGRPVPGGDHRPSACREVRGAHRPGRGGGEDVGSDRLAGSAVPVLRERQRPGDVRARRRLAGPVAGRGRRPRPPPSSTSDPLDEGAWPPPSRSPTPRRSTGRGRPRRRPGPQRPGPHRPDRHRPDHRCGAPTRPVVATSGPTPANGTSSTSRCRPAGSTTATRIRPPRHLLRPRRRRPAPSTSPTSPPGASPCRTGPSHPAARCPASSPTSRRPTPHEDDRRVVLHRTPLARPVERLGRSRLRRGHPRRPSSPDGCPRPEPR